MKKFVVLDVGPDAGIGIWVRLKSTMWKWTLKLRHHGVDIGADERLTNVRYADDLMLCAVSCEDMVYMIETLMVELQCMGLQLNASKLY